MGDPSMCRLCHVKVDGFEEGSTDYVQCPSCVCAKFGLDMDACKPVPKEPRHLHCSARNAEEFEVVDMCDRDYSHGMAYYAGEGYFGIDMRCKSTSKVGCIGMTGCRLCHIEPPGWTPGTPYVKCPHCVCEKQGIT